MPGRVITTRELNRALLARQLLLERSSVSIVQALEQVGGLQTQYAPSGYVGLWSRLAEFDRESLTRKLETKAVVQATLMRATIHIVSAGDYPLLSAAIRAARREQYLRLFKMPASDVETAAARVGELLADGPRKRADITKQLGISNQVWYGVGLWLDLVRVPPSGTWKNPRADLYLTAESWLGPSPAEPDAGVERLVTLYLSGFGPARAKDIANWGGLGVATVSAALATMELVGYRDEQGAELVDLPGAPLPDPETPAPVRFLPTWDATLLVHARRAQVLAEAHRPLVFNTKTPHSVPTFMVDGVVGGTWKVERGRVVVAPFNTLARTVRRLVDDEADRLTAFHA